MSANIYYQPVNGTDLKIGAPSLFLAAFRRAFGEAYPWELNEGNIHTLRGLAAAFESTDQREACEALIEAIERHGAVRVWPEY